MKKLTLFLSMFALTLASGCGGGDRTDISYNNDLIYEQNTWVQPDEEKDWDVYSLICDKVALGEELTEAEKASLEISLSVNRDVLDLQISQIQTLSSQNPDFGAYSGIATAGASGLFAFLGELNKSEREEFAKDGAYTDCLKQSDWHLNEEVVEEVKKKHTYQDIVSYAGWGTYAYLGYKFYKNYKTSEDSKDHCDSLNVGNDGVRLHNACVKVHNENVDKRSKDQLKIIGVGFSLHMASIMWRGYGDGINPEFFEYLDVSPELTDDGISLIYVPRRSDGLSFEYAPSDLGASQSRVSVTKEWKF